MTQITVRSADEAIVGMQDRQAARLPVFPVSIWAEGHGPGKAPLVVNNQVELHTGVAQAIGVSRAEFSKDGAVLMWSC